MTPKEPIELVETGAVQHQLSTPDQWGELAEQPARVVARDHSHMWAASRLPDSLADLDTPMQILWAAIQLAISGADHDTLSRTLSLTDETARQIIVATTEHLIATRATSDGPD